MTGGSELRKRAFGKPDDLSKRALPRGIILRGGRFHVELVWNRRVIPLGVVATLAEAVALRWHAEQGKGWSGPRELQGLTLAQRQAKAQAEFEAAGGLALVAASIERHKLAARRSYRRAAGWCDSCAETVPVGSGRPQDCAECQPKRERKAGTPVQSRPQRRYSGPYRANSASGRGLPPGGR